MGVSSPLVVDGDLWCALWCAGGALHVGQPVCSCALRLVCHVICVNRDVTVKTLLKESPYFGVRPAKVLKLRSFNGSFCPNCRKGRGNVIKYGQKSLLVAVQSVKGHICFTKLF